MEPGRTIYAVIDYSYAGHDLGSANVYLDPKLEIAPASFTQVYYVNPLLVVAFVILVLVIALIFFAAGKSKKHTQKRQARPASYGSRPRQR